MAVLTRAQAEAILVDRCGPWMTKAGIAITTDGANASLNDPLRQGLSQAGCAVADPSLVTDDDLDGLDDANLDEFLDRAELRVLKTCQRRFVNTSVMVEGVQVMDSDLLRQITEIVRLTEVQIKASWGLPTGGLTMGITSYDFAEALPDCDEDD